MGCSIWREKISRKLLNFVFDRGLGNSLAEYQLYKEIRSNLSFMLFTTGFGNRKSFYIYVSQHS